MTLTSQALQLSLDPASFAFTISVDGEPWFNSSSYSFSSSKTSHSLGGGLTAVGKPAVASGTDSAGAFDSIALSWSGSGGSSAEWITTFKAYKADRSALVFQQTWPEAMTGTDGGSVFPSLREASAG